MMTESVARNFQLLFDYVCDADMRLAFCCDVIIYAVVELAMLTVKSNNKLKILIMCYIIQIVIVFVSRYRKLFPIFPSTCGLGKYFQNFGEIMTSVTVFVLLYLRILQYYSNRNNTRQVNNTVMSFGIKDDVRWYSLLKHSLYIYLSAVLFMLCCGCYY